MSLIHLRDKVAIVSGASRGIGEAIALAFAEAGAKLVVASRKQEGVEAVAARLRERGTEAHAVAAHVGNTDQCHALVKAAIERFGRVDVLVNCAGTNPYFGPMVNIDPGAYEKTFEVNLRGAFETSRVFAQHVIERKGTGSIVTITSVAGLRAAPLQGVYGMTKAALNSMTQTLAFELGQSGVRVNAIAPGLFRTPMLETLDPKVIDSLVAATEAPKRLGTVREFAHCCAFVIENSYLNGETIRLDGAARLRAR